MPNTVLRVKPYFADLIDELRLNYKANKATIRGFFLCSLQRIMVLVVLAVQILTF